MECQLVKASIDSNADTDIEKFNHNSVGLFDLLQTSVSNRAEKGKVYTLECRN